MNLMEVVNQAAALPNDAERVAFFETVFAKQPELRPQLEQLLGYLIQVKLTNHENVAQQPPTLPEGSATSDYAPKVGIGSVIAGKYKIREKLGEGGMGTVYIVDTIRDVKTSFALKLIKSEYASHQVIARFEQERQALALMNHPNIAKFIDAGTSESGQPYFVMEHIKGLSITTFCDQEKLTVEERLTLFQSVCHAVQHAHMKGIIHRDLKPGNILVTYIDGKPVPKVIDFGVAKATLQPLTDKTIHSEINSIIGTLEYMAPEQAEVNSLDIDTRADIYALGVILYELLTGALPFSRKELVGVALLRMLEIIRLEEPAKPSTKLSNSGSLPSIAATRKIDPALLMKKLRGEIDWIIMKCLEKERGRRYIGPNELAKDIDNYLHDLPLIASPPSKSYRLKKFLRRHQGKVIAASVLVLSLVGGVAGTTWGMMKAVKAEEVAKREAATATATKDFVEIDILQQVDPAIQANAGYLIDKDIKLSTLLDRAVDKLTQGKLEDQPLILASLELTLGKAFIALGEYKKAEPRLKNSISLRTFHLGKNHLDTIRSKIEYCRMLLRNQQYALFEPAISEVEETAEHPTGMTGDMLADTKSMRATLLEKNSKYPEAMIIRKEVLALRTSEFSERHPKTVRAMQAVAGNHIFTNDFLDAEKMFLKTLEVQREVLGNRHPETLITLMNLTSLYSKIEEGEKAERLAVECLEAAKAIYQPSHPFYMRSLSNLAASYKFRKNFTEALPIYEQLLGITRQQKGPDDADALLYQNNLAAFLIFLKEYKRAENELIDLIPRMERKFSVNHRNTLIVKRSLVQLYEESDQLAKAMEEMEKVLIATRSTKPVQPQSLYVDLVNLTAIKIKASKYQACDELLNEAISLEEPNKTPTYLKAMLRRCLATVALHDNKIAEARRHLVESAILMKTLKTDPQTKSFANDERQTLKATMKSWLEQSKLKDAEILQLVNEL
jgi:non-specific serine/threonine protein kinase/serine/threonine-protein kinase